MKEINGMFITALCAVLVALAWVTSPAAAQEKKPNILINKGNDVGINNIDAWTLAGLLKARGSTTGQCGKTRFGGLNQHLPTVHGFDEFPGNLYHLNAEE